MNMKTVRLQIKNLEFRILKRGELLNGRNEINNETQIVYTLVPKPTMPQATGRI